VLGPVLAAAIAFDADGAPVSCAKALSQKASMVQAKAASMTGTRRGTMEFKTQLKIEWIFMLVYCHSCPS
jgi:hypothetical protein